MAKVKRNTQNLAATTATTTTPLKTFNGKVRKVRVNIKNLKLQTKHDENKPLTKSKINKDLTDSHQFETSTTRECFVKLRRAQKNVAVGSQYNNTLQAQRKVNEKCTNSNKLDNKIVNVGDKTKNAGEPIKSPTKSGSNLHQNVLENKKNRTGRSIVDLVAPPISNKVANSNKTPVATNKIPTRRCVVKIKRAPKDNTKNIKNLAPSTPICPRKCLVRLERTPKTSCNDESHTVVPVLDETKRNNVRKLSLTKSSNENSKAIMKSKKSEITSKKISQTMTHNADKDIESETTKVTENNVEKELFDKNNHLTKIKHVKILSLKRQKRVENNVSANLEITQFEPQLNSTIFFAPVRNSTIIELDFNKNKNNHTKIAEQNNEQEKEKETENTNSKNDNISPSSQNFANKSQEIEKLLDSLDGNDVDADIEQNINNKKDNVQDNQIKHTTISNKTNKFFHRQDKNLVKEAQVIVEKKSPSKRKSSGSKRRRFLTKRSSLAKSDNIYEFLSQSQTSDSDSNKHLDPAADIIKKLIAQGKVRVATNCKGKGRPKLKRNAQNKPIAKKVKQTAGKKLQKNLKEPIARKKNTEVDDYIDNDEHFMDDFDHDEHPHEVNNNMEEQHQDPGVKRLDNKQHHQHRINDQEGTFSCLARSVLINQTGRSDLQRQKAQRLLEIAKKFVSTPKNKKMSLPQEALHSNLSPIAISSPRPAGNASPWRVDEDAHLPRVFNFNRSSGNLPSFSSDFIPSTPRKEKSKNKTTSNLQPQSPLHSLDNQSSIPSITPHDLMPSATNNNELPKSTPPETNEQSILSSFSSNDSNAENMPPPKSVHITRNENDNIFDLKQYPNPKRTLNYRSPLKAINILEVIHLPPYKTSSKTNPHAQDQEKDNEEMFGFEEDLNEDSIEVERSSNGLILQKSHCEKSKKSPSEDLFGFEDFLTQTDISSQEICDVDLNGNNKTIHDKLQDLRKLRPEENELQFVSLKEKTRNLLKTKALFDDGSSGDAVDVDGLRQRGIKEMLCSTMINSPQASTSKAALAQLKKRNLRDKQKPNFIEDSNLSELFKDPDPEVTFNENDPHRTYIRPYKRKRRLKENKFVMYLESDESGAEEDSVKHNKHHHSHETDTSSEKAPKKKRVRKEAKEKPEMAEFVHDFNEMCKEVDSYELIVEKSA